VAKKDNAGFINPKKARGPLAMIIQRIVETVREGQKSAERLVLLVGRPGSGKSKLLRELSTIRGWKYVNCRTFLTEELLEMVPKVRAQEAAGLIAKALDALAAEVVVLDDMQVLFAPVLQVDPLNLLKHLGRRFSIVAAWPGQFDGKKLEIAAAGLSDPKLYDATGLTIVQIE
jgi:type II secretory pathway predicted ATPase ExeA